MSKELPTEQFGKPLTKDPMDDTFKPKAVCRFGIIADVQYGDLEEQYNYRKTRLRFYRNSLNLLRRAVDNWTGEEVDCVVQLGDIIDGFNRYENASKSALSAVLDVLKLFPGPIYHTWGNHELYNFTQEELLKSPLFSGKMPQSTCPDGKSYYSFNVHRKLKMVVLNCYENSMLGLSKNSKEYKDAEEFLRKRNPNKQLNSPESLHGTDRRFVKMNGAVSISQLEWLKETLQRAIENKENVIVMGHVPIHDQAANKKYLCWNYEDILQVISKYSACVLCYFAGHDHEGGSAVDTSGILHVTFPGTIESCEADAYATAHVYNDRLVIKGEGSYPSYETKLRFPMGDNAANAYVC